MAKKLSAEAKITEHNNGKISVSLTCTKCGEPLVGTDKMGMHCKNRCFDKENKEAFDKINKMFGGMFSGMK
jgi:hypothetical protein